MERTLDDWITEAGTELGIDLEVDVRGLLDLARVVAHGVDRPAAPLSTFLVGYAAAQQGGGPEAVAAASARLAALAERWVAQAGGSGEPGEPGEPGEAGTASGAAGETGVAGTASGAAGSPGHESKDPA
ncbi:molybdopterin-guanine dinucleotide biosynthesis protein MobA [Kitasatospora sp. MMS16-BH015]|nr:molybdopterin-guanine dinucleotide biosynthesis protein MobA [Kitasatospora sp. MMS16-BH015]